MRSTMGQWGVLLRTRSRMVGVCKFGFATILGSTKMVRLPGALENSIAEFAIQPDRGLWEPALGRGPNGRLIRYCMLQKLPSNS